MFVGLFLSVVMASCHHAEKKESNWNNETGDFSIPELNLSYEVPTDVKQWAIANPDSLPEEIKFFGIDRLSGVMVAVSQPKVNVTSIEDLDSISVIKLAVDMVGQYPGDHLAYIHNSAHQDEFQGKKAMKFTSYLGVKNGNDTVRILNEGYFFSVNDKIAGILVTSQQNDSTESVSLSPYLEALRMDKAKKHINSTKHSSRML